MKRFLYNLFTLGFVLALIVTLTMQSRSYNALDEWRGWKVDGPERLSVTHLSVLSNFGRVEVMGLRMQVTDWFGRNIAVPEAQIPTYPTEQVETRKPTYRGWTFIDKYFPETQFHYGVAVGSASKAEPIDGSKPGSNYLSSMTPKRREDRWLLAVQYKTLAWLFAVPLIWRVVSGKRNNKRRQNPPGFPAGGVVQQGR